MSDDMNTLKLTSTAKLASGSAIPLFGLGVYQSKGQECYEAVKEALKARYRHVDSAQMYRNEELVGKAIVDSGVPRSDVFLTTKYNPSKRVRSAEEVYQDLRKSLPLIDRLGTDKAYIDLMLIHAPWGGPQGRKNNWEALARAQKEGWIKEIGVSNFGVKHLEALPPPRPALNQIEIHPWCQRRKIVEYCQQNGIKVEAYSPLSQAHAERFKEPKLLKICEKYKKEQAQVLLRWGLQKGHIVIPKSVTASRIRSNAQVYDFKLDSEDMAALDSLDLGDAGAVCWNPVDAE